MTELRDFYAALVESSDDAIIAKDTDGIVIGWNPAAEKLFGWTAGEMIGQSIRRLLPPDRQDEEDRILARIRAGERVGQFFTKRLHKDGSLLDVSETASPVRDAAGNIVGASKIARDAAPVLEKERRLRELACEEREQAKQIRLLLMEVNHRSKNMLTTIQALARRSAPHDEGFIARFEDRVQSLAINQDILVARAWREVPIDELVRLQLSFLADAPGEFRLAGPPLSLAPRAAEVIGMALHELATNSLKYGALSVAGGHVDIGWSHGRDGAGLAMWWREHGGPPVREPAYNGFGTTLIRDVPRHNLGAEVTLVYHRGGVCWELCCDDAALAAPASAVMV